MHIRAFFSVELPTSSKEQVANHLIQPLQKHFHDSTIHWTTPDHLHITLQFLAELDAFDVEKLTNNVRKELAGSPSFFLQCGQVELFPTHYTPHIISLSVGPADTLTLLAKKIGNGILKTHYPIETRLFRGHLTLGRIEKADSPTILLHDIKPFHLEKILINEIVLFRSELDKEGPHYTKLAKFILSDKSQD